MSDDAPSESGVKMDFWMIYESCFDGMSLDVVLFASILIGECRVFLGGRFFLSLSLSVSE